MSPLHALIMVLLGGFIGKICFKEKVSTSIISTTVVALLLLIANMLATTLFVLIHNVPATSIQKEQSLRIQFLVLLFIFFFAITLTIWHLRILKLKIFTNLKMNVIFFTYVTIMLISLSIAMCDFTLSESYLGQISMWGLIFIPNIIFMLWIIEYMRKQGKNQQNLLHSSLQNSYMEKLVQQLINSNEQIQQANHDFKHQVNILQALDADGKAKELSDHLNTLATTKVTSTLAFTGNTALDALLSIKKQEAKIAEIDFEMCLEVEPALSYLSMDICVLLANALDNAFEAAKKCDRDNKKIDMELTAKKTTFLFRMRNTLKDIPKADGEILTTSKTNALHHGVGLKSMAKTCRDLNGKMTYQYDKTHFMILIVLPV
ncbi:MAG: GHKL domain-containing protein [Lachnospiraceae bacterium]|nr:GHKL domain-containing protein [Lachnospiraceae bacterium]